MTMIFLHLIFWQHFQIFLVYESSNFSFSFVNIIFRVFHSLNISKSTHMDFKKYIMLYLKKWTSLSLSSPTISNIVCVSFCLLHIYTSIFLSNSVLEFIVTLLYYFLFYKYFWLLSLLFYFLKIFFRYVFFWYLKLNSSFIPFLKQ